MDIKIFAVMFALLVTLYVTEDNRVDRKGYFTYLLSGIGATVLCLLSVKIGIFLSLLVSVIYAVEKYRSR